MIKSALLASSLVLAIFPCRAASAQDFTGPHVGAQAGWEQTEVRNPETGLGTVAADDDAQSFTGAFFVGYDREVVPRLVLGAEAGMDFSADDIVESTGATGLVRVDPDWSIDVTARAGYLADPQTLAYVRGGYTNASVETSVDNGTTRLTDSENRNGWVVGAGIERLVLQNISGRLEYRYSDLSEGDGTFDRHRVLAGITYRF